VPTGLLLRAVDNSRAVPVAGIGTPLGAAGKSNSREVADMHKPVAEADSRPRGVAARNIE
jgi:hypothetical protein